MSDQLTWWVGDRNPAISDQLTAGGTAVDLSTPTVQFKMRSVGGTALLIDQPVTTKDAQGNWSYTWGANDLAVEGRYLVWLDVTTSGRKQTLWESLIEVRPHSATHNYVELEEIKQSLALQGR